MKKPSQKVKNSTELFHSMIQDLLLLAWVWLAVMQIPWLIDMLIPRTTGSENMLHIHILQKITPVAGLVGFACLMLVFYYSQCKFAFGYAQEHSISIPHCLLRLPIIRLFFWFGLIPDKNASWLRILCSLQLATTVMAWGFWIVSGPMNFYGLAAMLIGILAGIQLMKRLCGGILSRFLRIGWLVWSGLFFLFLSIGYFMLFYLDTQLEAERVQWRSAGIPLTRNEAEVFYYQGTPPCPGFTELCDRYLNRNDKLDSVICNSPSGYYQQPESERQKGRVYLTSEQAKRDFGGMEQLIESKLFLKYRLELKTPMSETLIPHVNYERELTRWLAARIIYAVEEKDRAEAMRLFRLMTKFQETALRNNSGIGALVAAACENIRCDTLAVLLGSGFVTDADLDELEQFNHGREKKLHSAFQAGIRDSAAMGYEFAFNWTEFYTDLERNRQLTIRTESDEYFNFLCGFSSGVSRPMLFLLRGRGTRQSPLFLWTEVFAKLDLLYWMQSQRSVVNYGDDTDDYYLRSESRNTRLRFEARRLSYLECVLNTANDHFFRQYANAVTFLRMSDLSLKIERFRRHHGHLPKTLNELGVKLPVDALSGESIRYTYGKIRLWEYDTVSCIYKSRELPGWQLSSPGRNWQPSTGQVAEARVGKGSITQLADNDPRHEAKRLFFTVITQWPVPAPPESPKVENSPFKTWQQSLTVPK
ncbi:MAG: hypothetical protein BWY31_03977 [Lentisphaerae bacterium ADurb.Bin242]|nr:MAG: hypothetical protein BWY31_03977 [Lentisphaerae bacterium ADurb.Bin242]